VLFGDWRNETNGTKNFKIKSLNQIYVFIELNQDELDEELVIETDQNLQKFFFTESDGQTLRLYLNSFDNNTDDTIYYAANTNGSNRTNAVVLENGTQNYLKSNSKTKIYIKSSSSFLQISKFNFDVVNVYFKLNRSFGNRVQHNSFNKFNCNGQVLFNNEFIENEKSSKNLTFITRNDNQNIFIYLCRDLMNLTVAEKNKMIEFSAVKIV
jgi:hypothetical protein